MGLRGDFKELSDVWDRSPWRVKLFLMLSGFLASASLASISDVVVKWKGFFLTAVTFYNDYMRGPVASWCRDAFGISVPPSFYDVAVLMALMLGAVIRGAVLEFRVSRSRVVRSAVLFTVLSGIAACVVVVHGLIVNNSDVYKVVRGLLAGYVTLVLWCFVPPRGAVWFLIIIYLTIPPLLVGIAGGVNLGLK